MKNESVRSHWRSPFSYFLVTSGAIIGLGNFFQFPFYTIKYGGLFFLFFILAEILFSVPLMLAELAVGRRGRQNPVGSIGIACIESDANPNWRKIGWVFFLLSFLTLSYYSVSGALPADYLIKIVHASFQSDMSFKMDFFSLEVCFLLFLLASLIIVSQGIHKGLEAISFIVVPAYFFILIALVIYIAFQGFFFAACQDLFRLPADQSILSVMIAAISFALFNLNVGMGSMIVYGSYLPYDTTITRSTCYIVSFDIFISLLAYFVLNPLLLHAKSFDGLADFENNVMSIFLTAPHGMLIAFFYFFAAVLAAWTPTIAMTETLVVTLTERYGKSRVNIVVKLGLVIFLLGTLITLTRIKYPAAMIFDIPAYESIKYLAGWVAPIAALLMALFAGWGMRSAVIASELKMSAALNQIWRFLVRYIIPAVIVVAGIAGVFEGYL